ncbi:MAG TPA: hypothetical protein VG448_07860 [Solirubrobacterales bacterium]|nr:hypothetical protein [Solirubrobacterales bacterium]
MTLLALAAFAAPAAMAAEAERVLDPRLSLIGGCSGEVEVLDEVEDPGCPTTPPPSSHPSAKFANPRAVTTDDHGDIYVSVGGKKEDGTEGRIDIFSPEGVFLSEIPKGVVTSPQSLAVDSVGTLYVWSREEGELFRFDPCAPYDPEAGEINYCDPPVAVDLVGPECVYPCQLRSTPFGIRGLAIGRQGSVKDHLFFQLNGQVAEFTSAAEGNEEIRANQLGDNGTGAGVGVAVDSTRHRMYDQEGPEFGKTVIAIFNLESVVGTPPTDEYEKIGTIEASAVPEEQFGSALSIAVDEGTGDIYVYDPENSHLWKFDEDGNYLATVNFPFQGKEGMEIAIDNSLTSPNGKLSEEEGKGRYLYVPSHPQGTGHVFAFFESSTAPPEVLSTTAANVTETEAELQARIVPNNLATTYTFEFKPEGAADWTFAGEGTLAAGNLPAEASAAVSGLSPGTHYIFRVLATNEDGSAEAEGSFATYPSLPVEPSACPNALFRTGFSAQLPDCRAFELVTPPDTNARAPLGAEGEGGGSTSRQVSPAGDKVPFRVVGGALPGLGGTGGLRGDPYLAERTPTGWSTSYKGPSGTEAIAVSPGTTSPDQGYSFWIASGEKGTTGSAVLAKVTSYIRYPDGHSELVGQGSLGIDPESRGELVTENGSHIVFRSGSAAGQTEHAVQLEPDAAPDGTSAVYDRTADGVTHVVSLKPGNIPFAAGEDAGYAGASPDGTGIAFKVDDVLYLRYADKETFKIGEGVKYAGLAEGGGRIFYVQEGDLKAFDVATGSVIVFADTGAEVVPVTVSNDGSTAYFVSKSAVTAAGRNPAGSKPKAGAENLYRSKEGQLAFVGTVTPRDVEGAEPVAGKPEDGLGFWVKALSEYTFPGALGLVPARSTPDGAVFLFKSRAPLTGYDTQEHAEIYRYDATGNTLQCLSCNPTGLPARSDSTLQSTTREGTELASFLAWPENLRADGRRAFFESYEPLVASDSDGVQDVYEWEDQGVGSCLQAGGCIYLISSPQSRRNEYLWAVSQSGDDVFILSPDLLVGSDVDETPSIYDARVGGGFPEPTTSLCEGEGCRPQLSPTPALPSGETPVRGSGDNFKNRKCAKGKRKVKRAGKVRCVKKKRHHRQHTRHRHHHAGTQQKGGHR